MRNQRPPFLGRGALTACCVLIVLMFALASPAFGEPYPSVPTPTIEGPIPVTETSQIFMHTNVPLSQYGYVEEEYFLSGTGYTYTTSGPVNETGKKILTGGPNSNGTYPFKTRIVVRRPEDPANFNGKVVAEWQNVTAGFDLEPQWVGDPYYLMHNGYTYVAVDAQNVGIEGLKKFDPERYNSLQTGPSGDTLSYDMYAAALKAIRGDGIGPEPLGDLTSHINNVTASGASQSCGRLATDYNKVMPLQEGIASDLLLTDCTSSDPSRPAGEGAAGDQRNRKPSRTDRGGISRQPSSPPLGGRGRLACALHGASELGPPDRTRSRPELILVLRAHPHPVDGLVALLCRHRGG